MKTVWVLGDQLNRRIGALGAETPDSARVLIVESSTMVGGKRYHKQRLHLVLTAMRRFADELRRAGFEVDYRREPTLAAGLDAHRKAFSPSEVVATEPNSLSGRRTDGPARSHSGSVRPVPVPPRRLRSLGGGAAAASSRGFLPLAATSPRLSDGRRRTGRRGLELRP